AGDEPWRFSADAGFHTAREVSRAEPAEFTDQGLPRRNPRQHLVPGSVAPDAAPVEEPRRGTSAEGVRQRLSTYRQGVQRARDRQHGPLDVPAGDWRFAADVGWRAANAVSTSTPVNFTPGGLPRRTPPPVADGRAEELRGRLGSLQRGLSRGRQSLAERGAANGIPDNEQQESQ
ncbi:MAG TPA: hypothetical protein VHH15_17905, partial [Actinophytocola sp.]|nr:hypothetical protein [Actinophytocola sp.]